MPKEKTTTDKIEHARAGEERFNLHYFLTDEDCIVATDGHRLAMERNGGYSYKPICLDPETLMPVKGEYPNWRKVIPNGKPLGAFQITREIKNQLKEIRTDDRRVGYGPWDISQIEVRSTGEGIQVQVPASGNKHAKYKWTEPRYRWNSAPHVPSLVREGITKSTDGQPFEYAPLKTAGFGEFSFFVNCQYLLDAVESMPMGAWLTVYDGGVLVLTIPGQSITDFDNVTSIRLVMSMRP